MALVGLPGTPRARSGTSELPMVALVALSAAMMPSGLPCSKVSGVLEVRLASGEDREQTERTGLAHDHGAGIGLGMLAQAVEIVEGRAGAGEHAHRREVEAREDSKLSKSKSVSRVCSSTTLSG
jgi:hypothetical protein